MRSEVAFYVAVVAALVLFAATAPKSHSVGAECGNPPARIAALDARLYDVWSEWTPQTKTCEWFARTKTEGR